MAITRFKTMRSREQWEQARADALRGNMNAAAHTLIRGGFYATDIARFAEEDQRQQNCPLSITELLILTERVSSERA